MSKCVYVSQMAAGRFPYESVGNISVFTLSLHNSVIMYSCCYTVIYVHDPYKKSCVRSCYIEQSSSYDMLLGAFKQTSEHISLLRSSMFNRCLLWFCIRRL